MRGEGTRNADSAESASVAAWNRRERGEGPRRSQRSASAGSQVLKAPVVGPPHGIAARGERCPRRFIASLHRVRRKGLAPWSSHGPRRFRSTTGTQSVRNSKRLKRHGEESPLTGLAFVVRDARRTASSTGLKHFQCGAGNAPLQSRKLPISVPRAESTRICHGLDVASFYLWFRASEYRGDGRARRCHFKADEKRRWRPERACSHQHWQHIAAPVAARCHWATSARRTMGD